MPAAGCGPLFWIAKSISVVVPPKAAAIVPDSKSSALVVPPKGISRCVWTSMPPGITSRPVASITLPAFSIGERLRDGGDVAAGDADVAHDRCPSR